MKQDNSIECEFCGTLITTKPQLIKVEGALLNVCVSCMGYGNVVNTKRPTSNSVAPTFKQKKKEITKAPSRNLSRFSLKSKKQNVIDIGLTDDFNLKIKSKRMEKHLSQMQLAQKTGISNALIQSIETGKIRPTDLDIKKIERVLGISLMEEIDSPVSNPETKKIKSRTLGDILNIKKLG